MMNCSRLITFQTPWGRYCWRRMPCGISPALEYFQQKLDKTLEDLNGVYRISLFRQRTKPLLPTPRQLLQPELVTERKKTQSMYYNRNAKDLPKLVNGETVRIQPTSRYRYRRWVKAQVERQVHAYVWSYSVHTEDGRCFRRNRRHLRRPVNRLFLKTT